MKCEGSVIRVNNNKIMLMLSRTIKELSILVNNKKGEICCITKNKIQYVCMNTLIINLSIELMLRCINTTMMDLIFLVVFINVMC